MISRTHLTTLLGVAAILWGGLLVFNGVHVSAQLAKPFSLVLGILLVLLDIFDRWLWRWPLLHSWFVSRPNLQGTWKGQILPSGIDLESGHFHRAIDGYLVIRQTYSSISIRLLTQESSSELLAGNIVKESDGMVTVFGTYRNTPRLKARDGSPIHFGGLLLHVQGVPASILDGQYWTDRSTRGELHFDRRDKILVHTFEEATQRVRT